MMKDNLADKKNQKNTKRANKFIEKGQQQNQDLQFASMSRTQFISWLRSLSPEERYLTLKVLCPQLIKNLLAINSKFGETWKVQIDSKRTPTRFMKNFMASLQAFIDGLVLISDQEYLDSVGFDFSFVGSPEKLFDTLSNLKICWIKLKNKSKVSAQEQNHRFLILQKQQWLYQVLTTIQEGYTIRTKVQWDPMILERQKSQKKQFGIFWKLLAKTQKINFLLLGHENVKNLVIDFQDMGISLDPLYLQDQISEMINLDKKQICNKIYKCKVKKCSVQICGYYEMIYNNWREFAYKKKHEEKNWIKKKHKIQKQKIPQKKRQKSVDQYSNETNETEMKNSRFEMPVQDIQKQLEQDILQCTDYISQKANKLYERRQLAFERIAAVFRLYGVSCKLFGSCANGISIYESDIDIAINEHILKYFQKIQDKKSQMGNAFQFMGQIFQSLPWVKNVKIIKTAAIPIIKLIIDTDIEVEQQFFTEQYRQILNRRIQNGGQVQADLTIQTKQDDTSNHLGIVSTNQINQWLEEIPTLRSIVLLLKFQLSKHSLNQTYLGGINTYCLVVMVVSFIYSQRLQGQKNVARVLSKLLTFYGWQFDEKSYGIDLRDLQSIFYEKKKDELPKFAQLEVKDPLNLGKVMTKNCYEFDRIKEILRKIYNTCYIEKQKILKEQNFDLRKKLSKRMTKQQSQTQSGQEKEKERNFFLQLAL